MDVRKQRGRALFAMLKKCVKKKSVSILHTTVPRVTGVILLRTTPHGRDSLYNAARTDSCPSIKPNERICSGDNSAARYGTDVLPLPEKLTMLDGRTRLGKKKPETRSETVIVVAQDSRTKSRWPTIISMIISEYTERFMDTRMHGQRFRDGGTEKIGGDEHTL